MKLKLITFDVTGTLLSLRQSVGHQYSKVGLMYGINVPSDNLAKGFKCIYKELTIRYPNFGVDSIGWKAWWKELVLKVFLSAASDKTEVEHQRIDKISNHLIDLYKTNECWKLVDGAEDLLDKLHNKNLLLGVVSNYDPRLDEILRNLKIDTYFDFVLTSYKAKCGKPNLGIFKAVEEINVSLQKSEILHIGDNPELDYMAAKNAGWNALLISDNPKIINENYPAIDKEWILTNVNKSYQYLGLRKLL